MDDRKFQRNLNTFYFILGGLAVFGIVGSMDYHDQRRQECALRGKDYNVAKDFCQAPRASASETKGRK